MGSPNPIKPALLKIVTHCYFIFNFKLFLNTARVWELLIYAIHCARFKTCTQDYFIYLLSRDGDRTLPWNLGFMTNWWIDFKARVILCQFPIPVLNNWQLLLPSCLLRLHSWSPATVLWGSPSNPYGGPYGGNWEREWATLESAPAAPSRHALALTAYNRDVLSLPSPGQTSASWAK